MLQTVIILYKYCPLRPYASKRAYPWRAPTNKYKSKESQIHSGSRLIRFLVDLLLGLIVQQELESLLGALVGARVPTRVVHVVTLRLELEEQRPLGLHLLCDLMFHEFVLVLELHECPMELLLRVLRAARPQLQLHDVLLQVVGGLHHVALLDGETLDGDCVRVRLPVLPVRFTRESLVL